MPDPHQSDKSKVATPPAIAFVVEDERDVPLWSGHDWISLGHFLDDCDALGFAVWETPSVIYVFCGRFD